MKNKIILIISLCIFLGLITINKLEYNNNSNDKKHYFKVNEIKKFKDNSYININYKEKYFDNIIMENNQSYEYNFFHKNESILGNIYIGTDKKLYITDSNKNKIFKVSDIKFNTMYSPEYQYSDGIYIYLLSEDGIIYMLSLESNNIEESFLRKYIYDEKFVNFVDINFKKDMFFPANAAFALTEDNIIYEFNSGLRYEDTLISLYNKIYVYSDKTMTNILGNSIQDKEGNNYKIKYIFNVVENNEFIKGKDLIIVITKDNKFIYFSNDTLYVYEFDKKVKDLKYDQYYPYIEGNLEITFEDNYKVDFTAKCNQYFCINEFID